MNEKKLEIDYSKYDFKNPENYEIKFPKGLSEEIVEEISRIKNEPDWMRKFRLNSLKVFLSKPMPQWGGDLSKINFDDIVFFASPTRKKAKSWDELPEEIKRTYERLGIPEAERKYLAGVEVMYESEVVYNKVREELEKLGVIFCSTDEALQKYPDIFKTYFGKVVPPADNKFAALNSAVWSGGSFIYVPEGVKVAFPLQAYFRLNASNMGQFERTLIIAEPNSEVTYIEGCSAPIYSKDSLHAAVVEIIAKKNAHVKYITIQNWSSDVYNLVTKRAFAYENAYVEWIDSNIGCLVKGTKVLTNNGIKNIEDINVGEKVYSLNKNFEIVVRKVIAKKENPKRNVYKLITSENHEIIATGNHPILSMRKIGNFNYICWKKLEDIRSNDLIAVFRKSMINHINFVSVKEIKHIGKEITYDIEVEYPHNFIADGIFVHNSKLTMKYPSVFLLERNARANILSIAFAAKDQHQDTGAKAIHLAPNTSSRITSKSVCMNGGRVTYRGLVKVVKGATNVKSSVRCDALILDDKSRTDTYPYMEVYENDAIITHEASVGKIGEDKIFYLRSRGISEEEALNMIVLGFIEEFIRELPFEYAVEFNRLINLKMEDSVG